MKQEGNFSSWADRGGIELTLNCLKQLKTSSGYLSVSSIPITSIHWKHYLKIWNNLRSRAIKWFPMLTFRFNRTFDKTSYLFKTTIGWIGIIKYDLYKCGKNITIIIEIRISPITKKYIYLFYLIQLCFSWTMSYMRTLHFF